jgi:hypothetical protein
LRHNADGRELTPAVHHLAHLRRGR